jgi:hyperosmotically inducible periplasmic protein
MLPKTLLSVLAACAALYVCNGYAQGGDVTASAMAPSSKSAMKAMDRKLAHAVRAALTKTKGLSTSDIRVLARSGDVTLAGSMTDADQIDRAGAVVASVPNVKSVHNRLTIRTPGGH